jgi:NAD(P)-dependent dehydrogenase (short-subunit alcohol dehydrogenase family)
MVPPTLMKTSHQPRPLPTERVAVEMETPHQPGPLLTEKVAVVTGAARGIGAGITAAFLAHGAHVLAVDRDPVALGTLRTETGGSLQTLELDVTTATAGATIAAAADADVLVNNVGHYLDPPTPFADSDAARWEALRAVNLDHVLAVTRAVLPGMIERRCGGSVINLTTVEAFRGIPGHAVYSACKAAVTQFTTSLAVEVGRYGVRVNAIAPDVTETPQLPYSDWVAANDRWRWRTWVPLARPGTPHDAAGAALFLASLLGAFVTGTTVHVDGGTRAAGGWYPRHAGGWTNRPLDP